MEKQVGRQSKGGRARNARGSQSRRHRSSFGGGKGVGWQHCACLACAALTAARCEELALALLELPAAVPGAGALWR